MTNLGALAMESGLRAEAAPRENGQRQFALRLLRLPQGNKTKEVFGTKAVMGQWHATALVYTGRTESTVLLEEPETVDAGLLQKEEAEAKAEAERPRSTLTMFTDGPRMDDGNTGYSVDGRRGNPGWASKPTWAITRMPMAVYRTCPGTGIRLEEEHSTRSHHHLHPCTGGN